MPFNERKNISTVNSLKVGHELSTQKATHVIKQDKSLKGRTLNTKNTSVKLPCRQLSFGRLVTEATSSG